MSKKKTIIKVLAATTLLVLAILAYLYYRPLPIVRPVAITPKLENNQTPALPWPNYGQTALGAQNYGLLETHGAQTPAPTASIAKIITALAVLKQKPLKLNQQGPIITIGQADVDAYNSFYSQGGSVATVTNGEQISEYQALRGMLLPSANNMAFTLSNWAFGSLDNYLKFANNYVKTLGLDNTSVADASGFSSQTVSSAQDLVLLGEQVLDSPVLSQIIAQPEATLPVAGIVKNTNWLLGVDGIRGIKTGNTDQAGGCYLFAADRIINGQKITVVGAVMGAPTLNTAIADSRSLVQTSDSGFQQIQLPAGQTVGIYNSPWATTAQAITKSKVDLLVWKGKKITTHVSLEPLSAGSKRGAPVGELSLKSQGQYKTIPVILKDNLITPSLTWRLSR